MRLSVKQQKYVCRAIDYANTSTMQSRHGAVLTLRGRPISGGRNHYRDLINGQKVVSCHAEIDVLYKYMRQSHNCKLTKVDLWVVRVIKDASGNISLAESAPCFSCVRTLQKYGLRKVWWSTKSGGMECSSVKDLDDGYVTKGNERCGLCPQLCLN